jgi:hypothetical protein
MKRLLSRLGLFDVVWSAAARTDGKPYSGFVGWRIVRFDKEAKRPYFYVSRCIRLKRYIDGGPDSNHYYTWYTEKPGKCTCCTVHGAAK